MSRFHVNPETGKPGKCDAQTPESCLYYDSETETPAPHFATMEAAYQQVEKDMAQTYSIISSISKPETPSLKFFGEKVKNKEISNMFIVGRGSRGNDSKVNKAFKSMMLANAVKVNDENVISMFAA